MKNIKIYSLRPISFNKLSKKVLFYVVLIFWFFSVFSIFSNSSRLDYLTDILWKKKISYNALIRQVNNIKFNGTTWPVKQITDLNYKTILAAWTDYKSLREKKWSNIPYSLRTTFPTSWSNYIRKYKNITLKSCWEVFTDPNELANFTFRKRVLRTIWTASYSKPWEMGAWTHAGIDIIWNVWTPVYSIANWLVIETKKSNKGFWNMVAILYKKNWKYYIWFYGHLNSISSNVKVWKLVSKWEKIWTIWNSWNSFWAHLHFQLNKVSKLKDILNWKAMIWLFHSVEKVRKYTVNPITFIESSYSYTNDSLKVWELDKEKDNYSLDNKIIKKVVREKDKKYFAEKIEDTAFIKNISINLIDNKVQIGKWFTMVLNVSPWKGKISIIPSNSNISYYPDVIENPSKKQYIINFLAVKEWITKLRVLDSKTEREYNIKIYKPWNEKIYGLLVKPERNLNLLVPVKVHFYPVDRYWRKIKLPLRWKFKIYLLSNNEKKYIKTVTFDTFDNIVYLKWINPWKWKIIVENDKLYNKSNIITDLALDYSYKWNYVNSIYYLIENKIVKGYKWYLLPKNYLTRAQLLIVLWRSILNVDYKKTKQEMLSYIKKHWKFFKDIDGTKYADPYIYYAWKKWIIKWIDNYSLAGNEVTKSTLLLILTRVYNIHIQEDELSNWKDLQHGEIKAVADTVKKYGLYPFKDFKYFNPWKKLTREIAFETLKRFIDFKPWKVYLHTSAKVSRKNSDSNLNSVMTDIFDF